MESHLLDRSRDAGHQRPVHPRLAESGPGGKGRVNGIAWHLTEELRHDVSLPRVNPHSWYIRGSATPVCPCHGVRPSVAPLRPEPPFRTPALATRVPHRTDKPGIERTTTVNSTTLMSWPPLALAA